MAQSIYFNESNPFIRPLTAFSTGLFRILAPKTAMRFARKMLLEPKRNRSKWSTNVKSFYIETSQGKVKCYFMGSGPPIWFIHGWSGSAYQFKFLMSRLAKAGYMAVSFDLPAHGNSEGKLSSLPEMIFSFDEIAQELGHKPINVVCHSMGTAVLANSNWFKDYTGSVFLISPLFKTYQMLKKTIEKLGFDRSLFDQVVDEIGQNKGLKVPSLDAEISFVKNKANVVILHDKDDPYSPIEDSRMVSKYSKVQLVETENKGHSLRIINNKETYKLIIKTIQGDSING